VWADNGNINLQLVDSNQNSIAFFNATESEARRVRVVNSEILDYQTTANRVKIITK
jgi:hypothetical protein